MSLRNPERGVIFSDIHFGRKSNSPIHNQDCIDFIKWMCAEIELIKDDIDYVAFLGDWYESRNAIDVFTLDYSYEGAKLLNAIGLPIYFIVGNHDLGMRVSRDVFATKKFAEFSNFVIISEPLIVGDTAFIPFIQPDEYPTITNEFCKDVTTIMGHFEFKGFVLTGYTVIKETGPDIADIKGKKTILTGHFHKRQSQNTTHYIGSTFPMDYSDTGDLDRGFAIYTNETQHLEFRNWAECPKYIRGKLSDLLDGKLKIMNNAYVQIEVDIPLEYSEVDAIEKMYNDQFNLREFKLDDSALVLAALADTTPEIEDHDTNEQTIVSLLGQADEKKYESDLLIKIFMGA